MYETIAGSPFVLVAVAGVVTLLLVVMYVQTNDSRLKPFIIVAALLTLLPILTDALITTNREAIKGSVSRLTRAVRMNDVQAALKFAHPESKAVYEKIKNEMPNYEFTMCNLAGIRSIELSEDSQSAVVKFTVIVNVDAKYGAEGFGNRGITLDMKKDADGAWKIKDYQHYPTSKRSR